jgi:alkylation response protein AidB-like acyl-CoA dehydrogenase
MDFEFSEEQESLRDNVRRYLEENAPVTPYVRGMVDDERGFSEPVWKGLAEMGLLGILIPEEQGGSGLGMLEMGVVLEEMGRLVHPGPYLSTALAAVSLIRAAGSGDDVATLLPPIAEGRCVATVALHEAKHRFDWCASEAVAEESAEAGKGAVGWSLTGCKDYVFDGMAADLFLVVARAADGLGIFVLEAGAPGLKCSPTPGADGTRKQARLELSGSPARRLGKGDASAATAGMLDRVLIGLTVDGVGAASRALELGVAYAREREQFGVPVGSFQAIQHMLAGMLQQLELGRAGAYYALWAADQPDAAECHRAAVMAKAFSSDEFARIGSDAIQVFAGVGFTWEYDIHFFYKRLLGLQHAHGGSAEYLEELAAIVLA